MSTYPTTLDNFVGKTDNVDDVMAADVNELQSAIIAIEEELGLDPAGSVIDLVTRLSRSLDAAGMLNFLTPEDLTITSGVVTVGRNYSTLDTEGGAGTDDLETINGGATGLWVIFRLKDDTHHVTIKHGTDNISCATGLDIILSESYQFAFGIYDGTLSKWLITASGNVSILGAALTITQADSAGAVPVLELSQADIDDAFINFAGTTAADQTKSISTKQGDGAVEGPKAFSASAGWTFTGMVRIEINGTVGWMPYYVADTA